MLVNADTHGDRGKNSQREDARRQRHGYSHRALDDLAHRMATRPRAACIGGKFDGTNIDYRLREARGKWLVFDVVVDGISILLNYRDQFKSVLSREGAEELIAKVERKNRESE